MNSEPAIALRNDEIERLHREGMTLREIAREVNLSYQGVKNVLVNRGIYDAAVGRETRRARKVEVQAASLDAFDREFGRGVRQLLDADIPASEIAARLTLLGNHVSEEQVRDFAKRQSLVVPFEIGVLFPASTIRLALQAAAASSAAAAHEPLDAILIESDDLRALESVCATLPELETIAALAAVARRASDAMTLTKEQYAGWREDWLKRFPKDAQVPWPPTHQTVLKRLGRGAWNDAVKAAGLTPSLRGRPRGALVYRDADEHVGAVAAFLLDAEADGLRPTFEEYERWRLGRPVPSGAQIRNTLGTWNIAKRRAAGIAGAPAVRERGPRVLPADELVDRFVRQVRALYENATAHVPTQGHKAVAILAAREEATELLGDVISAFEAFRRRWVYAAIKEDTSRFVARLQPNGLATNAERREWASLRGTPPIDAIESVVSGTSLDRLLSDTSGDLRSSGGWLGPVQQSRLERVDHDDSLRWRLFKTARNVLEHHSPNIEERFGQAQAPLARIDPPLVVKRAPASEEAVKRWIVGEARGASESLEGPLGTARVAQACLLVTRVACAMRSE